MAQQLETIETPQVRSWKYKIEQTAKGSRITVHGGDMAEVVNDYVDLREALVSKGYKIAPEE